MSERRQLFREEPGEVRALGFLDLCRLFRKVDP